MNETKAEQFWINHHKLSEPFTPEMCFCPKCKTQFDDNTMNETKKQDSEISSQLCERCEEVVTGSIRFCCDCMEEIAYNEEQANPRDGLGY